MTFLHIANQKYADLDAEHGGGGGHVHSYIADTKTVWHSLQFVSGVD